MLLFGRDDADQMGVEVPAALLGSLPGLALREVQVAVALELSPALLTDLLICSATRWQGGRLTLARGYTPGTKHEHTEAEQRRLV